MPMPNLSSVSIDGLLKRRDEVEKALSRRAKELHDQLSRLGRAPALRDGARACSAPIESGGFSWGQRWESLSALIRFWEAVRCRRPILGRCGNE